MAINSRASLDRSPGSNWVEEAGGLPMYIRRIANHLHQEQGFPISRAIAVAVNTVKRWAAGGSVRQGGGSRVTAATQAKAAAAVVQWEKKKAGSRVNLAEGRDQMSTVDLAGKWKHGWIPLDPVAISVKARRNARTVALYKQRYGGTAGAREAAQRAKMARTGDDVRTPSRRDREVEAYRAKVTKMSNSELAQAIRPEYGVADTRRVAQAEYDRRLASGGGKRLVGPKTSARVQNPDGTVQFTEKELRKIAADPDASPEKRKVARKALAANGIKVPFLRADLENIANDPNASPERRAVARKALGPPDSGTSAPAQRTDMSYEELNAAWRNAKPGSAEQARYGRMLKAKDAAGGTSTPAPISDDGLPTAKMAAEARRLLAERRGVGTSRTAATQTATSLHPAKRVALYNANRIVKAYESKRKAGRVLTTTERVRYENAKARIKRIREEA